MEMNFAKDIPISNRNVGKIMKDGDLVIVYERHDTLDHFYLEKGKILNNKFGSFYHDDIIGKPFGSKIRSRSSNRWVYILEPTPELWSTAVHTRTQIVNELDSSVVTLLLDVYPGCKVVESGTGSGCMTLSLARAVSPNGHIFTYEYNAIRAEKARQEFAKLGVDKVITVTTKDVTGKFEADGSGGFVGVPDNTVDAVFLDLPEPWLALDHAMKVLKSGRNICCYSPCMEQVMKTCEKLRELKFHSIRMIEVRQRPYDGRRIEFETLDLGLNDMKKKSDENNDTNNGSNSSNNNVRNNNTNENGSDDQITDEFSSNNNNNELISNNDNEADNNNDNRKKRQKTNDEGSELKNTPANPNRVPPRSSVLGTRIMPIARPVTTMKGHTAFLTFAVCPLK